MPWETKKSIWLSLLQCLLSAWSTIEPSSPRYAWTCQFCEKQLSVYWHSTSKFHILIVFFFQTSEFFLHGWELKLKLQNCTQSIFPKASIVKTSSRDNLLVWSSAPNTQADKGQTFIEQELSVENISSYYHSYLITLTRPLSIWIWLSFHILFFYAAFCFPSF